MSMPSGPPAVYVDQWVYVECRGVPSGYNYVERRGVPSGYIMQGRAQWVYVECRGVPNGYNYVECRDLPSWPPADLREWSLKPNQPKCCGFHTETSVAGCMLLQHSLCINYNYGRDTGGGGGGGGRRRTTP